MTREEETHLSDVRLPLRDALSFTKKKHLAGEQPPPAGAQSEKSETGQTRSSDTQNPPAYTGVTDDEWYQASRSLRTAGWGAVFYLITTDVLGPYSVPWAFAQMGYGPGVTLYTVFGALAG
jgi:hypothetical protein